MLPEAQRKAGIRRMAEWWASAVDALLQEWIVAMDRRDSKAIAIVSGSMLGILTQMVIFFKVGMEASVAKVPESAEQVRDAYAKAEKLTHAAMDGSRDPACPPLALPGDKTPRSDLN